MITLPSVHLVSEHMVLTFISNVGFMQIKHLSEKWTAAQKLPYIQYDKGRWTSKVPILLGLPSSAVILLDPQKVQFQNATTSALQFHTIFFMKD